MTTTKKSTESSPESGTNQSLSTNVGSPTQESNTVRAEVLDKLANIAMFEKYKGMVADKIKAPFNVSTPKEKVKKRPDGFDYVEGTWMDHVTKEYMPLYEYKLLHTSWEFGWISIIISLEDKITGNVELGAGSARIQVRQGVETPGFRDVIDMGNNIKAALTQAIKNAQSRFGVAADIYGKRESMPTDDERKRFQELVTQIKTISPTKAKLCEEQWEALGTDYTEFIDRWTIFLDRNKGNQGQSQNQVEVKDEKKTKRQLDL